MNNRKEMKPKITLRNQWYVTKFFYKLTVKIFILIVLILTGIPSPAKAQVFRDMNHPWWFGMAVGANLNFYRGSTQGLNSDLISPAAFHNGSDAGLYFAPMVEFHRPGSGWGMLFQAGYDDRTGSFNQEITPCDCAVNLSTGLKYITVEPSLLFAPFKSNFYLYAGPRLAFNLDKSFNYIFTTQSDINNQEIQVSLNSDFSNMNKVIISMQIGMGYDLQFSKPKNKAQFIFSPFASFQPYFGQSPRSVESWNITTLRFGAAFKYSQSKHKLSYKRKHWNK